MEVRRKVSAASYPETRLISLHDDGPGGGSRMTALADFGLWVLDRRQLIANREAAQRR